LDIGDHDGGDDEDAVIAVDGDDSDVGGGSGDAHHVEASLNSKAGILKVSVFKLGTCYWCACVVKILT
jgi:hypothetical protein